MTKQNQCSVEIDKKILDVCCGGRMFWFQKEQHSGVDTERLLETGRSIGYNQALSDIKKSLGLDKDEDN